ncbi:hypothetical protein MMC07_004017 [Pseudocyphellaria aurata]|nr:hypothetical protein [Pseudocyphellaria aurata]
MPEYYPRSSRNPRVTESRQDLDVAIRDDSFGESEEELEPSPPPTGRSSRAGEQGSLHSSDFGGPLDRLNSNSNESGRPRALGSGEQPSEQPVPESGEDEHDPLPELEEDSLEEADTNPQLDHSPVSPPEFRPAHFPLVQPGRTFNHLGSPDSSVDHTLEDELTAAMNSAISDAPPQRPHEEMVRDNTMADRLLAALPVVDIASLTEEEKACLVCTYAYREPTTAATAASEEPSERESAVRLRCQHVIGKDCLSRWLKGGNKTCPICRGNVYGP